jgi:hypothetical protein
MSREQLVNLVRRHEAVAAQLRAEMEHKYVQQESDSSDVLEPVKKRGMRTPQEELDSEVESVNRVPLSRRRRGQLCVVYSAVAHGKGSSRNDGAAAGSES